MSTNKMNILFVCSRNKWRSLTAETIFKNNGHHNVKSCGTANSARIKINQKLISWADTIYVMEHKHKSLIMKDYTLATNKNLIVLDIPDIYKYMDEELIHILQDSIKLN